MLGLGAGVEFVCGVELVIAVTEGVGIKLGAGFVSVAGTISGWLQATNINTEATIGIMFPSGFRK